MPHVAALYRYPVKGFTPESRESIRVLEGGRIEGDRVLALLLGTAGPPEAEVEGEGWWSKRRMLSLMSTPGLARLALHYDDLERRVRIELDGSILVDAGLDEDGREQIAGAVAEYALTLDERPDLEHAGRLPLRLVGDGVTARYQDSRVGYVSLHGRASLLSLAEALGDSDLDERRFRSNIAIEGTQPWEEFDWAGARLRVGAVEFEVRKRAVRCLATHASPTEGVRDREVLTTLTRVFGHEEPSFAVMMVPVTSGEIRLGDEVQVLN
jgi:uncharacterized protein